MTAPVPAVSDVSPTQILVLGMHRSGTSGVTRLLNLAGAHFGPDGIATEANEENPKGFWERRDVRAVCDGLLHGGGFDWWKVDGFSPESLPEDVVATQRAAFSSIVEELDAHPPWVVKEPRLCLLLPVLLPVLDAPVCVHVTREPLEVAQSLNARGDMAIQTGLALWEVYTLAAYRASAGLPRIQVRHEDVISDPVGTTDRLLADLARLGVTGLTAPPPEEITAFITPSLHRQRRRAADRGLRLTAAQAALADACDDGSVLGWSDLPEPSEGSIEQLQLHEADRALHETLRAEEKLAAARRDELDRLQARFEAHIEAAEERIAWWEGRVDRVAEVADEALERADAGVRSVERSTTWRFAARLQAARAALTPGTTSSVTGALERVRSDVERGRGQVRSVAAIRPDGVAPAPSDGPRPQLVTPPVIDRSGPVSRRGDRPRVAVIAWDVGHNPIGRANVLAGVLDRHHDVEMWGARFDRYGTDVWAPLRDGPIPINHFAGLPFPGHLAQMEAVAEQIDADAIWVSKPRLPSYLLGALAKEHRNRPLVLDVDDHELAFFSEDEGLELEQILDGSTELDLTLPFERAWTRACDPLIGAADAVTVSNPALQDRYGGLIVPHARDERRFDPGLHDRAATRAQLGVDDDTRLLLFGGTPRIHKGIGEVLAALEEIGDDRYRLLVFGTRELDELRPHLGDLTRWALAVPYQPFDDLPRIVGAADLSCVLQDPTHPVARYQMPAKVTDALAMEVPCLVAPTPPLAPFIEAGAVGVVRPGDSLAAAISAVFDDPITTRARVEAGRALFVDQLSYAAVAEQVRPLFEGLLADPPPLSPDLARLIGTTRHLYGGRAAEAASAANAPPAHPPRRPGSGGRPIRSDEPFDVVMFWKQNDTGIYGRRQDMFLAELARSDRVGTIVHFDEPVTPEQLAGTLRRGLRSRADQGPLVVRNTVARALNRRHTDRVFQHTFVHGGSRSSRLGLPPRRAYTDHVLAVLEEHGVGRDRPVVVWAYPSNPDLPQLIDAIRPDLVVTDVVDDNRTWHPEGSPQHDRITRNYADVLARSDLVLANCEPVADAMEAFTADIHVIPNGCEAPRSGPRPPKPRSLRSLTGPIIGYVGNLSSRIDLGLLDALARRRPDWNLVLIGSAHLDGSALDLGRLPNVHLLGVKPHHEARNHMEHFDVGLIPHLDNEMTRSMNPLKAFVYCSAGIPVVSTPIANLEELGDLITTAVGPEGFEAAIEAHLRAGRRPVDPARLEPLTWRRRMERVMDLIDSTAVPT